MDEIALSKGSKLFFVVMLILLTFSVAATYYRYLVMEDYEIFLAEELIDVEN